jgi:hypothetical protein
VELAQFGALLDAVSTTECGKVPGETVRWYDHFCLGGVKQDVG